MSAFTAALDLRRHVGRYALRTAGHAGRFAFLVATFSIGLLDGALVPAHHRQSIASATAASASCCWWRRSPAR